MAQDPTRCRQNCLASSADGNTLAASDGSSTLISTNSEASWASGYKTTDRDETRNEGYLWLCLASGEQSPAALAPFMKILAAVQTLALRLLAGQSQQEGCGRTGDSAACPSPNILVHNVFGVAPKQGLPAC